MANSELPQRANKRGGPGWWMDLEGGWRAPEEWPEDTPPIDGWVRSRTGKWGPPMSRVDNDEANETRTPRVAVLQREKSTERRLSRQASADRKAMFTVAGALGAAALVLVAALILITQASAENDPETEVGGAVIFAADTEQVRMERRMAMAVDAPVRAREQLDVLENYEPDSAAPAGTFDPLIWVADRTGCLDPTEAVLVSRSQSPISWADQLECVPDSGRWTDRYLDSTITRTLDAEVRLHVPAAIAHIAGGSEWTDETRQAYLADLSHPATLAVTTRGSGHNPRAQGPSDWKPSKGSKWCAYAIDWIAVKARWELAVTSAERVALVDMLDTCDTAESAGADPYSMPIDPTTPAIIERVSAE